MTAGRRSDSIGDLSRGLREVSQLRKLWRGFQDPQDRLDDERLSRPILDDSRHRSDAQETIGPYGLPAVRAAIRRWWARGEYAAIVQLGEQLTPDLLDSEPLIRIYCDEAAARLAVSRGRPATAALESGTDTQ